MPETFNFELVGPHEGKTITFENYNFVDGVFSYETSEKTIPLMVQYLARFHNAHLQGSPELEEAKVEYEYAKTLPPVKPQTHDIPPAPRYVEPPAIVPEAQTAAETAPPPPKPTLAEAVNSLNPETDDHWTGLGLPSVEFVSRVVGEKVTRAQIDEAFPNFDRKAAKAAAAV